MKMKNNLYVSPSVEIIEVAVEAGIAASTPPDVQPSPDEEF